LVAKIFKKNLFDAILQSKQREHQRGKRHIDMNTELMQLIHPIFKTFSWVQIVLGILEQKLHAWYQLTNRKLHAWTGT
jgi:hypothetical protein